MKEEHHRCSLHVHLHFPQCVITCHEHLEKNLIVWQDEGGTPPLQPSCGAALSSVCQCHEHLEKNLIVWQDEGGTPPLQRSHGAALSSVCHYMS